MLIGYMRISIDNAKNRRFGRGTPGAGCRRQPHQSPHAEPPSGPHTCADDAPRRPHDYPEDGLRLCSTPSGGAREDRCIAGREDAKLWIIANQLARRNLRDEQRSYLRGKYWDGIKKRGHPGKDTQSVSLSDVAAREHVHSNTVIKDAQYAAAVDTLEHNVPGAKETILAGESGLPKAEVVKLAEKPQAEQQAARGLSHRGSGTLP